MKKKMSLPAKLAFLALSTLLSGCGGGGGSGSESTGGRNDPPIVSSPPPIPANCIPSQMVSFGRGNQSNISVPALATVVVELTGLQSDSVLGAISVSTTSAVKVVPYTLNSNNNCSFTDEGSTISGERDRGLPSVASFPLSTFDNSLRYFFALTSTDPSLPALVQVCSISGPSFTSCDSSQLTIFGRVTGQDSVPIPNATVNIVNGGITKKVTSDAAGNYVVSTAIDQLPDFFALTVSSGRSTVPVVLNYTKDGSFYFSGDAVLLPTGINNVVIEVEPTVHHLGDSNFSGSSNSQFQFPNAEGLSFSRDFSVEAASLAFPNADIVFVAKGVECANSLVLNGRQQGTLTASPSDGSYTTYSVPVSSGQFVTGVNSISLISADTGSVCSGGDPDDFEFANIVVQFHD